MHATELSIFICFPPPFTFLFACLLCRSRKHTATERLSSNGRKMFLNANSTTTTTINEEINRNVSKTCTYRRKLYQILIICSVFCCCRSVTRVVDVVAVTAVDDYCCYYSGIICFGASLCVLTYNDLTTGWWMGERTPEDCTKRNVLHFVKREESVLCDENRNPVTCSSTVDVNESTPSLKRSLYFAFACHLKRIKVSKPNSTNGSST